MRSTKLAPSIGRAAGEVDVVADQHRRAGRPGLVEPAAAVGQHDRAAAGGGRGADAVHDGGDALALVVVGAAEEDQQAARRRRGRCGSCRSGRRRRRRRSPGRSVVAISAVASPRASTAGSQPEPSTSATSWRSTPVSSASVSAASWASVLGGHGGRLGRCCSVTSPLDAGTLLVRTAWSRRAAVRAARPGVPPGVRDTSRSRAGASMRTAAAGPPHAGLRGRSSGRGASRSAAT